MSAESCIVPTRKRSMPPRHAAPSIAVTRSQPVREWDDDALDLDVLRTKLRPRWMDKGACRTADVDMFPTERWGGREAQAVCERCPVRQQCGDYALEHRIRYGTWGGLSERQRMRWHGWAM